MKTNWFPTSDVQSGAQLIQRGFFYHFLRFFPKMIFKRTASKVKASYNQERQDLWNRLESYDWDAYILFPEAMQDFILIDDQVKFGAYREARTLLVKKLEQAVATIAKPGGVVVEFGSGDGRNILYLKTKFPQTKFVGVELSDVSVELSKAAAKKFNIDGVDFICANATEDLSKHFAGQDVVCCYSSFALEMMPRIFVGAVKNMLAISKNMVVFFEPVDELWTTDLRGLASKLRVRNLDRLQGLYKHLKNVETEKQWTITKAERPGIGINPFNEMVEIQLRKNG